jgi:PPM family protein phosphatase
MICWGKSDIGKNRKMNQDAFLILQDDNTSLAIVCDGMGGAKAGEVASSLACQTMRDYVASHPIEETTVLESWLRDAVTTANQAVYTQSLSKTIYNGMGTTLVGVLHAQNRIVCVNVGDSRIYGKAGDIFEQLTEDHSLVYELMTRGLINQEQSKIHPQRHVLTNALGIGEDIRIDIKPLEVEYERILISSDGLHSMLEDHEIQTILDTSDSLESVGEALISAANEAGGNDNITVVVIDPQGGAQ